MFRGDRCPSRAASAPDGGAPPGRSSFPAGTKQDRGPEWGRSGLRAPATPAGRRLLVQVRVLGFLGSGAPPALGAGPRAHARARAQRAFAFPVLPAPACAASRTSRDSRGTLKCKYSCPSLTASMKELRDLSAIQRLRRDLRWGPGTSVWAVWSDSFPSAWGHTARGATQRQMREVSLKLLRVSHRRRWLGAPPLRAAAVWLHTPVPGRRT